MKRQYIPLALLGLALVPDWATALGGRRWCLRPPPPCPPRIVFVPPCPPIFPVAPPNYSVLPAPTVQVEPAAPPPAKPEPTKPNPAPAAPRPVAPGVPPGTAAADPGGAVKPTEFAKPESAPPPEPKPTPKPDIPKLQVPQVPLPGAADTPKTEDVKIPPLVPRLSNPDMPPLTLPQVPVEGGTSTSKASPLTGTARVDIYPVDGPPPASPGAKRKVGFFNHSNRDLTLTVEGESVTLPRRHYVNARVPAAFTWKLDGAERQTEIPAAAPGVEVVIRK
ncbi:MAG TPA: hypothetical protein VFG68_22785 [Fimbriiglobus sp.]|nr:hypothetical protein [Fimbriiglobus sp.]